MSILLEEKGKRSEKQSDNRGKTALISHFMARKIKVEGYLKGQKSMKQAKKEPPLLILIAFAVLPGGSL